MSPKTTASSGEPGDSLDDARSERARTERMSVAPLGGGLYRVRSGSDNTYYVDLQESRCTCPDHVMRGVRCKHLRRVAIEINEGRVPPPGKESAACDVCGRTVFVDETDPGPRLCSEHELRPGDTVVDRESGDLLVVVAVTRRRASEVRVPGHDCTAAEYPKNEAYDPADLVVEVLYPLPAGLEPGDVKPHHLRRYSFPLSRLVRRRPGDDSQSQLHEFAGGPPATE